MPNRLFYTVKLDSDFIINNNCKITGEKATFQYFKQKDKMSKSASIAIFNAILNVGEVVQVPLWHSGFWVTLRPIKERDIINLNVILKNNVVEMGRYSNTLVYTNYNVNIVSRSLIYTTICIYTAY